MPSRPKCPEYVKTESGKRVRGCVGGRMMTVCRVQTDGHVKKTYECTQCGAKATRNYTVKVSK